MKVSFLPSFACAFCVLAAMSLPAQEFPLVSAEVHESGARLKRAGEVQLDASGRWNETIYGLDLNVAPATIQVHLPDGWSLSGIAFQRSINVPVKAQNELRMAEIDEEMDALADTRSMRTALHETYNEELQMLLSNRTIRGNETLLVEDLREAANFWRDRVKELKYFMLELDMEIADIDANAAALRQERDSLHANGGMIRGAIALRLQGPANGRGSVEVDYVTSSAGWRPVFEASVDPSGVVQMRRFAETVQRTGNDWSGIDVAFAAGNPMQGLAPPEVETLRLQPVARSQAFAGSYEMASGWSASGNMPAADMAESRMFEPLLVTTAETGSAVDRYRFEPLGRVEVPGNGQPERIALGNFELQGKLRMLSLPSYADEAYQMASTSDWSGARLMPGEVQVIAGGAYRGAFNMTLPAPGDTLEFPVGQDPQVRSSRVRMADKCKSSALGGKKSSEVVWEITLQNQHNRQVEVRVLDRVPVSGNENIEVEVNDLSGGKLDPVTGQVSWQVKLGPGEQRKLLLSYKVTYPKSYYLPNL